MRFIVWGANHSSLYVAFSDRYLFFAPVGGVEACRHGRWYTVQDAKWYIINFEIDQFLNIASLIYFGTLPQGVHCVAHSLPTVLALAVRLLNSVQLPFMPMATIKYVFVYFSFFLPEVRDNSFRDVIVNFAAPGN